MKSGPSGTKREITATSAAKDSPDQPERSPEAIAAHKVHVDPDREGQRIDNFLMGQLKGAPRSLVYRLLRTGQVRINGGRAKPDRRLAAGDEVRIPPMRDTAAHEKPAEPASSQKSRVTDAIIHEDRNFLVIDKPSGVASHGGSGISFGAIELLRAARPRDTLELAHRLDRDTSGILVFSRRRSALLGLQTEIREGRVIKRYLGLVEGALPQARLTIDAPLRKSVLQGGERMVRVDRDGKASRSVLVEVDRFRGATLAEITLETGRTHQIRVHCAHIDHPLAGDEKYGDEDFNRKLRKRGLTRLFLHAAHFQFELGENSYSFSAPLPPELARVIDSFQKK